MHQMRCTNILLQRRNIKLKKVYNCYSNSSDKNSTLENQTNGPKKFPTRKELKPSYRAPHGLKYKINENLTPILGTSPIPLAHNNPAVADGFAQRFHNYEKIRDWARSFNTIEEKIDITTPHERDWTRPEWHRYRSKFPKMIEPRGAWDTNPDDLPGYSSKEFYEFITRTVPMEKMSTDSIKCYEESLLAPPKDIDCNIEMSEESRLKNNLKNIIASEIERCNEEILYLNKNPPPSLVRKVKSERVSRTLKRTLQTLQQLIAQRHQHFADIVMDFDRPLDAYWMRSGFDFVYQHGLSKRNAPEAQQLPNKPLKRFKGDHYLCYGELAFRIGLKPIAVLRTRNPLIIEGTQMPSNWLEDGVFNKCFKKILNSSGPQTGDVKRIGSLLRSTPLSYNMTADNEIIDMRAGYAADEASTMCLTHPFVHTVFVDATNNLFKCNNIYQLGDGDNHVREDTLAMQAMITAFGATLVQAHALGFTLYDDLPFPIETQCVVTDSQHWLIGTYRLNTMRHLAFDLDELKLIQQITNLNKTSYEIILKIIDRSKGYSPANQFAHSGIIKLYSLREGKQLHETDTTNTVIKLLLRTLVRPTVTEQQIEDKLGSLDNLRPYLPNRSIKLIIDDDDNNAQMTENVAVF